MKRGLWLALGVFVVFWFFPHLFLNKATHTEGFFIGGIAAILVLYVTAFITHLRYAECKCTGKYGNCPCPNRPNGCTGPLVDGNNQPCCSCHDTDDDQLWDDDEPGDYDDDCCGCPCAPCHISPPRQNGVAEPQCCSCHDNDLDGDFDEGGSG